jgi:acetyl esterase/lipase
LSVSVSSQEEKESEAEEIGNNVDASPAGDVQRESALRLPDAMMLCCPALNLSLDLSPSREMNTEDPVLPSGLISAISEAYLPGIDKRDPIASPYFAPDYILRIFPPTLLFASSDDPLLDDSVNFNARLRRLGVQSDLRAVHNMPHAYWGLGTAGFPEAQQVQCECQEWLSRQFYRDNTSGSLPPTPPVSPPSVLKDDLALESTI